MTDDKERYDDEPVLCDECEAVYVDPADIICIKCFEIVGAIDAKPILDEIHNEYLEIQRNLKARRGIS